MEPAQGIMFVKCCRCGAAMESVPVALDDPANGLTSHGLCAVCEPISYAEIMSGEALDASSSDTSCEDYSDTYCEECDERDQT